MKQCDLTKGLVVFLTIMITILFCGLMPGAWAQVSNCDDCNNVDVEGCYAFSDNGKLIMLHPDPLNSNWITASMACVGLVHLENGIITGFETTSLGPDFPDIGGPIPGTITEGWYNVNEDCTGTAGMCIINDYTGEGIRSTISFVISEKGKEKGKEIQMVTTNMEPCGVIPPGAYFRPINIIGTLKRCDD